MHQQNCETQSRLFAESSNTILASNSRTRQLVRSRNRRPQGVDALPPDASIVAVPPPFNLCSTTLVRRTSSCRRQGVLNQARYHMWQERKPHLGPPRVPRTSLGQVFRLGKERVSVNTPNYALSPGACGAAPTPAKPSVSPN